MVKNIYIVWKMNTHYLHLYILGHEPTCCYVEDEYTYYLHLYILGYEHFCCLEDEYTYYI